MKALIRAMMTKYWAIDPEYASRYGNVVKQIFNHEKIDQLKDKEIIGKAQYLGNSAFLYDEEIDEEEEKTGNINVIPVKGVVVKYDTLCELGTSTMAKMIQEGEKDDDVSFHFLDIDSGGGQVDGTSNLGREIKKAKKPVVAFVNGLLVPD